MKTRSVLLAILLAAGAMPAFADDCPAGTNWCSGLYKYDGMGNIRAIGSDTYIYDTSGRLVSGTAENQRGGTSRQDYGYDTFGNRTSASRISGSVDCLGGCEQSPAIDAVTNHITGNSAAYDAAGNLISIVNTVGSTSFTATYVYDAAGSMARATAGSDDRQFIYTADDERIATRNGQSWTWTVRGLDNKVLREFTSLEPNGSPGLPTTTRQWSKDYVWRDGLLLAAVSATGSNITEHFHLDHLGTPRLVSNDAGVQIAIHAYYAFGAELNLTPETPVELMKFTGHERDLLASNPNTLDYMHARYGMATMGRLLSVDPTFDSADLSKPQAWNRYPYVKNNPLILTDSDGKCPICILIVAGAVGGMFFSGDVLNAPAVGTKTTPNDGPASAFGGVMKGLMYAGGGNAISNSLSAESDNQRAREVADHQQADDRRGGTAGSLRTRDGQTYDDTSGPNKTHNPEVKNALDRVPENQRSPYHGKCAEPGCISKALDNGSNPRGGDIQTAKIRGPNNPQHGAPHEPCSTCKIILDFFGIKY
jgi:RHS repeat-associated protein